MTEGEEELKSLLVKVKEESEIVGLKLNIHKTKIMASGPVTSLANSNNSRYSVDLQLLKTYLKQWETILGGSRITADGDCSHDIKRSSLEEKLWPT